MSYVRNADDFLLRYREIRGKYERSLKERIIKLRNELTGDVQLVQQDYDKALLEAHIRVFFIDALLTSLNWTIIGNENPDSNVLPEAPIASIDHGTTRFLDYLGVEKESNRPLVIVETKRPNSPIPQRKRPLQTYEDITSMIASALNGTELNGEWNEWLKTLSDYTRSTFAKTKHAPQRVVITNGDWLLIFLDPFNAFISSTDTCDSSKIFFMRDRDEIEARSAEIYRWLEYIQVLGKAPSLSIAEITFNISPKEVDSVMHGLKLAYIYQPSIYAGITPVIKVAPILFLKTQYGAWLQIEDPDGRNEFDLPHNYSQISNHLDHVQQAAIHLLERLNKVLNISLLPTPLNKHFEDPGSFALLPAVKEESYSTTALITKYLIVTGENTHYFRNKPSSLTCPHNDWQKSNDIGLSIETPIIKRQVDPRSFFINREEHFCSHREVRVAKSSIITATNRERCGSRSGLDGQAFCEITSFEGHLCCRTCIFESICTKSEVFNLPC